MVPMLKKKPNTKSKSQCRIIGGQWRGRKLAIVDVEGLRPTGDRIRETLFNWLQQDIVDARCLDCFAGTGALSFEALSRGAASVVLLEQHPKAAANLREHTQLLGVTESQCDVIQTDALAWLENKSLGLASIDIVFIDPPFSQNLWQPCFAALEATKCLAEDAWIYIEMPKAREINPPSTWQLHREKFAGDVHYCLYQKLGSH